MNQIIYILVLNFYKNLVKNRYFHRKLKFRPKNEILVKNKNFRQKSKVWSKIEIFVKNRNFGQKSRLTGSTYPFSNSGPECIKQDLHIKSNFKYFRYPVVQRSSSFLHGLRCDRCFANVRSSRARRS